MSLVNDMLRDLEARRATPVEREQLGGLYAADETGAARRERFERIRRWVLMAAALAMVGIALALWVARLPVAVESEPAPLTEVAPVDSATQLLEILPQNDGQRFVLQLLLDSSFSYQRTDEGGSVSLRLNDTQWRGEPRSGRIENAGKSLSWRVEEHGGQVRVLLVGLADQLEVRDRLEPAGDRWQLWLEVPLMPNPVADESPQRLPVAEPAAADQAQLPAWVTRDVAAAEQSQRPEPVADAAQVPEAQQTERLHQPTQAAVSIGRHTPGALSLARQALQDGQHEQAIEQLQALHKARPSDPEVSRWLARAYLIAGETPTLLAWLPTQLQARPFDRELRELLARGYMQGGDNAAAIATLRQNPPDLLRDSAYHALLAALYQQVEDWAGSAAIYRQLVAVRPKQASWQLGLAIAMEQLGQSTVAGRHYRLALRGQGLDDSARRFASERAASLGETQ